MHDIWKWSALEISTRIRKREISVREVTQANLDRMADINPVINAIVEPASDALELAMQMDAAGVPEDAGPLYGVPVTTKSNTDQIGYASSNGIPAFADKIAEQDAPVISNLKKSGAVIIGRSNVPEFSMRYHSSNPLFGVTQNPWDASLTPGGSSGGAAAAVATGIGVIGHGSDLAGSLRYPAHCCGVTTIRPSFGRVPVFNPGAATERPGLTQTMSVHGPIARSIGDVRIALQAMSARDSRDPFWSNAQSSGRPRNSELRIGYCTDPWGTGVDASAVQAMETAVSGFRDARISVREITLPNIKEIGTLWGVLAMGETDCLIGDQFRTYSSPEMRAFYEQEMQLYGTLPDPEHILTAIRDRITYQRNWSMMFDEIDVVMLPMSLTSIFANDSDLVDPMAGWEQMQANRPMQVINVLGLPAASLPTNVINGHPVSVQLVGPMHDDWFVLDVAEMLERELGTFWQALPMNA